MNKKAIMLSLIGMGLLLIAGQALAASPMSKQNVLRDTLRKPIDLWKAIQNNQASPINIGHYLNPKNTINNVVDQKRLQPIPDQLFPLEPVITSEKGILLFSDSPEYVDKRNGILYEDNVQGDGRVYFYHLNEVNTVRKLAVLVSNDTPNPVDFTVKRKIKSEPSSDYFKVGREVSKAELTTPLGVVGSYRLEPHSTRIIFPELENVPLRKGNLLSGIVDFSSKEPMRIAVAILPYDDNSLAFYKEALFLPYDDSHLRGTFKGYERHIEVHPAFDVTLGPAKLKIADGDKDYFLMGNDATVGKKARVSIYDSPLIGALGKAGNTDRDVNHGNPGISLVSNRGNYGISEIIHVPTKGKGSYELFFNPLGGAFAGAIKITHKGKSKIWELPSKNYAYMGFKTIYDTRYLGTYEAGDDITIEFMAPGASNLPVQFLFIPK